MSPDRHHDGARLRQRRCRDGGPSSVPTRRGIRRANDLILVCFVLATLGCAGTAVDRAPEETREPVEARASVDRAVATTGDLITFSLTVDSRADLEVEIPEAGAEIDGFRIVDVGREEPLSRNARTLREQWYQLRADLVGSYVLPPVEIRFREPSAVAEEPGPWQTLKTSEIFVEVESVLPAEGGAEDIRGLKPLRRVRPRVPWLEIVLGLAALGLVAAAVAWYLRRRARQLESVPAVPPHVVAFEALDALRDTDFEDPAAVRRFHFRISEVIRTYVEGRFGMNATDLTTEEILGGLADLDDLAAEPGDDLRRFLTETDRVKFAHREPSRGDIESTYELALGFVETTRFVPAVDEDGEALQEAA